MEDFLVFQNLRDYIEKEDNWKESKEDLIEKIGENLEVKLE